MPILIICAYMVTLLAFVWALIAFAQALAAVLPWRPDWSVSKNPVSNVVLVPAHNEQACIARTVRSIIDAGDEHQRVLVVADNCSDQTAKLAAQAGADVIERHNAEHGGKPYALRFGIEHLADAPPEVVTIVDADCVVGGKGLAHVARLAIERNRPIQALNLIDRDLNGGAHVLVSILGNRFHNLVRPLGNAKLGLPCLLMGTGMSIPWEQLQQIDISQDSLGEDKQLGVDLAIAGAPPTFYPLTKVTSATPQRYGDYLGQRTRWEQGHLVAAAAAIPRLVYHGMTHMQLGSLSLAAELFVPPIAILGAVWALGLVISAVCVGVTIVPLLLGILSAALLSGCVFITWGCFSRRLPLKSVLAAPLHVLSKLPIYVGLLLKGPQRAWLRTERDHE